MKEGWKYKKIKDVGEVIAGTTPSTSNPEFWGGDICWISPAELHGEHYVYDTVKKITPKAVAAKSLKELPEGTVILSSRAPIGKIAINKVPMYCNQGFKCVVCGPELFNEFLYWWFYGKKDYLNSLGTGATFPEISKTVVENIVIPVAPMNEQLSIVSRLDAAFAHIDSLKANAEKQLAEARQLFQAELAECMRPKEGWEEKRLGEVCEIFGRIGFRGYTRGDLVDTPEKGAITLSPSNIVDGEMNYNKCTYITWKKYEESPEIMIYPGDILLVKTASVGKTALVKSLPHKATINPQFVVMKKITIDNRYLSYYLKTEEAQHYIWSIAKGAAAQTVSQKNLAEMKIPVPDDTVQQSIVSRLDALSANIKKLEEVQRKTLAECDALKQAMLREVFE